MQGLSAVAVSGQEEGSLDFTPLLRDAHWHEVIGDPTLADAILDRLVHNAYKIPLKGESMRKRANKLTTTPQTE